MPPAQFRNAHVHAHVHVHVPYAHAHARPAAWRGEQTEGLFLAACIANATRKPYDLGRAVRNTPKFRDTNLLPEGQFSHCSANGNMNGELGVNIFFVLRCPVFCVQWDLVVVH